LLLADLTASNIESIEIVAGKRYMGHEGKDPGEYDFIEHFAYEYRPETKTFLRRSIAGGCAGFGLDPRAVDFDGDSDIDLVAADRNGLTLIENKRFGNFGGSSGIIGVGGPAVPSKRSDRFDLLTTNSNAVKRIETPAQWAKYRNFDIVLGMNAVMGELPDPSRRVPLDVQIESREETPDYIRFKLTYVPEAGDRVPALLLVPNSHKALTIGQGDSPADASSTPDSNGTPTAGRGFEKLPAMLCLHPTNPDGKAQTAGLVGEATRHYGHQLAQQGFVCLIPDYPSFGDYKAYDFKQQRPGTDQPLYDSGTMKAIWNNIRGVDLLESLGYVDGERIGAIGHSLGGHNALYTAVFEPRIKAVATSCGFNAFHDYYRGDLKGWTSDRYMPRIRDVYENNPDKMPFDFPEVLAAIAPRAIYVAAPLHDANFEVSGVRKCIAAAQPVYDLLGGKDKLVAEYPDCEHDFPDDVRERVYRWLKEQLKN
jgi:pimeloyl-ACP methyl ester carboxylesterase